MRKPELEPVGIEETVYTVEHVHKFANGVEDSKLIGIYSSIAKASAAIERSRSLPGFCDSPQGFTITSYALDAIC